MNKRLVCIVMACLMLFATSCAHLAAMPELTAPAQEEMPAATERADVEESSLPQESQNSEQEAETKQPTTLETPDATQQPAATETPGQAGEKLTDKAEQPEEMDVEQAAEEGMPEAHAELAQPDEAKQNKEAGGEKAQWTVLMYMCGADAESELGMASYAIGEIAGTKPNESVNLLIQTGGSSKWQARDTVGLNISGSKLQRYAYSAGGYELIQELPLANMASADTLKDFIAWGAENYPAEKYLLSIWGHGGDSATGIMCDQLHGNAQMPLHELERSLKQSGISFEGILLDAGCKASLEAAMAVAPYAKYMMASEELAPGQGTSYGKWMQYLYDTPSCDGAKLGRVICDSMEQKYADPGQDDASRMLTFSVIDLSKVGNVAAAFVGMVKEMEGLLADPIDFQRFSYFTEPAERYSERMVDLKDMAERAKGVSLTMDVADGVIDAVNDAVVYSVRGSGRSYGGGLSFHFWLPASSEQMDSYARNCKVAEYLAFIDAIKPGWTAPEWVYEQTARPAEISSEDYMIGLETSVDQNGMQLSVARGRDAVSSVDYELYYYDQETGGYILLGDSAEVDGDFSSGIFTDGFDGMWPALDEMFCNVKLLEQNSTYNLFSIPVIIGSGPDAKNAEIMVEYVYDLPAEETSERVAAAESGNSEAGEGAETVEPNQKDAAEKSGVPGENGKQEKQSAERGDNVKQTTVDEASEDPSMELTGHFEIRGIWEPLTNSVKMPWGKMQDVSKFYGMACRPLIDGMLGERSIVISDDTRLELMPLPSGEYMYRFRVTDTFGNVFTTESVKLSWDGNTVTFQTDEQAE